MVKLVNIVLAVAYLGAIPWALFTIWGGVRAIKSGDHSEGYNAIIAAGIILGALLILSVLLKALMPEAPDVAPDFNSVK